MIPVLTGKVTDYGDLLHVERWVVKGRHPRLIWHIGVTADTTVADRIIGGPSSPSNRKADLKMDLQADKKTTLSIGWTDEVGNPTDAPADFTAVYTVDDPAIVNLTDNGDGTATAAAVGTLGTATVHVEATANGVPVTGDLAIVVVAGLAERLTVTAGAPEEITPDA
jgi:hypothetical protein